MSDTINTIQEKLAALTLEQKELFSKVKTEQELDAALADTNISLTAEEKALIVDQLQAGAKELTDDEADKAAGGAFFNLCPKGHFEASGFANTFGSSSDCEEGKCPYYSKSDPYTVIFEHDISDPMNYGTYTQKVYKETCSYFRREVERTC